MMKQNISIWALVLLLLIVSYSKSEAFSGYSGTEKAAGNSGTNRCYVFEKYLVQTWSDARTAGEGIKVGRRHSLYSDRQCIITESNEVLILNLNMGQWFAGISKDFLFVDYGTSGGGRGFGVYDLLTKKSIFTGNYESVQELQSPSLQGDMLFYFEPRGAAKSILDCPEKFRTDEVKSRMPFLLLIEKVRVDLRTKKKESVGDKRCSYDE